MSDVYRAEIVLPSSMTSRLVVGMTKAQRRLMGEEPWIVREYGYGTTDIGGWHDTPAAAWDAAADELETVRARYSEQIEKCREEARRSRDAKDGTVPPT